MTQKFHTSQHTSQQNFRRFGRPKLNFIISTTANQDRMKMLILAVSTSKFKILQTNAPTSSKTSILIWLIYLQIKLKYAWPSKMKHHKQHTCSSS